MTELLWQVAEAGMESLREVSVLGWIHDKRLLHLEIMQEASASLGSSV
jgi:hypothetical protein